MNEISLATLAAESLKSTSSKIIDALLSSKLERIKIWAEEKENRNRLEHYKTNIILEKYLKRLLRRISEIKTIVFPNHPFPLPSIYEPLSLKGKFDLSEKETNKEFNALTLNDGENYLIIDSAGMGKSTFVKHLVLDIVNSTIKIPIFLELRRIEENETLLQRIAKDIDESQNGIDEKLLLMLLDQGGFVIILDGYDELPNQFRKKISQQITDLAVRCDQNSLILTARPEVNLPEIPNSKAFTINRLEREQAETIALRYDNIVNLDIGKQLITQFDKVDEGFLKTPLFIALLYKTYGFNQSIATKITSFYDDVFNAFYKGHDLTKAGFAREKVSKLDAENFRRLLRGFSFLLIAQQKNNLKSKTEGITIVEDSIKLTSVTPESAEAFFDDLLLTVPLIIKDGTDYRFIHKSIGEFFAAEFLAFTSNSKDFIKKIMDGKSYQSFFNCLDYLADLNPGLFKKVIVEPLAKEVLTERLNKDNFLRTINFLGDIRIGIWNSKTVDKMKRKNKQTYSFTLLSSSKEKKSLAFQIIKEHQIISSAAWYLITSEIKGLNLLNFHAPVYKKLIKIIPQNKWISINSNKILMNIKNEDIQAIFFFIIFVLSPNMLEMNSDVRVLDQEQCISLIKQIKQESKTQRWLSSLIDNK